MNTEQQSRNQKLGDSSCLRAFVVKPARNSPRRHEDSRSVFHQSKLPFYVTFHSLPLRQGTLYQGDIMSVKKDPSGRRSVEVDVEVPGTPEEVWQAIATGPGVSSWFVPTEAREDGTVVSHFGPGMDA